jgi:hypothetical protein
LRTQLKNLNKIPNNDKTATFDLLGFFIMPHPKRRVINSCVICSAKFEVQLSSKDKKTTCSKECSSINKSRKRIGIKHKVPDLYNVCVRCKNKFILNGLIRKKRTAQYCSPKCQNDAHSERISGANSPNWKGGVTKANKRGEFQREIYAWRSKVFKRDNYKCQHCGSQKQLEAHHIIEWAKCVETRFDLDNGLTLCILCHGKVHNTNFGTRVVNKCKECKKPIGRASKMCIPCYYEARKNGVIVNNKKSKNNLD